MSRIVHSKIAIIIIAFFTLINLVDIFEYFIYEENSFLVLALPLFAEGDPTPGETGETSPKNPVIHMQRAFVALISIVLSVGCFSVPACFRNIFFFMPAIRSQIFVLTERPPPAAA